MNLKSHSAIISPNADLIFNPCFGKLLSVNKSCCTFLIIGQEKSCISRQLSGLGFSGRKKRKTRMVPKEQQSGLML